MVNEKMRCHFSIVFENVSKLFSIIFVILISQIDDVLRGIKNSEEVDSKYILLGFGVFILVIILIVVYNILVWSKTYIWVEDSTIVVERNTINKKKNTYGIRNISNINMEQNLFERIVGTKKLKIDTNSTANSRSADIKIVFSKAKAQEFKNLVMSYMDHPDETTSLDNEDVQDFDIAYSTKEVILHSIYATPIISLLVFIGSIAAFVALAIFVDTDSFSEFITMTVGGTVTLLITIISSVVSLTKTFFNFYEFRAKRKNDIIYLSYGLLKKKNYAVPVKKINAVKIVQPTIARIFKKYHVEIVNIGVGDEKNESPGLILSCSKEELKHHLSVLLPEYRTSVEEKIKRQSPYYFMHKAFGIIVWALVLMILSKGIPYFIEEIPSTICTIGAAVLFALVIVSYLLAYLTKGFHADKEYIAIANGIFKKTIIILYYDKIQYLTIKHSPVSKCTGLCKGSLFILANLINQTIELPYGKEEIFADVGEKIILN